MQFAAADQPSTVVISWPSAITANIVHDLTACSPSSTTTQHAAARGVAADVRAGQAEALAQEIREQRARLDVALVVGTVDGNVDLQFATSTPSRCERLLESPRDEYAGHVLFEFDRAARRLRRDRRFLARESAALRINSRLGLAPGEKFLGLANAHGLRATRPRCHARTRDGAVGRERERDGGRRGCEVADLALDF